jgi:hypothetical protein
MFIHVTWMGTPVLERRIVDFRARTVSVPTRYDRAGGIDEFVSPYSCQDRNGPTGCGIEDDLSGSIRLEEPQTQVHLHLNSVHHVRTAEPRIYDGILSR